jgi:hypothetical protein
MFRVLEARFRLMIFRLHIQILALPFRKLRPEQVKMLLKDCRRAVLLDEFLEQRGQLLKHYVVKAGL